MTTSDVEHFQRHHTNPLTNNTLQRKSDGDDKKQKQAFPAPFFAQGFTYIYITQYTIKETKGNKIIPRHPNPPCFL